MRTPLLALLVLLPTQALPRPPTAREAYQSTPLHPLGATARLTVETRGGPWGAGRTWQVTATAVRLGGQERLRWEAEGPAEGRGWVVVAEEGHPGALAERAPGQGVQAVEPMRRVRPLWDTALAYADLGPLPAESALKLHPAGEERVGRRRAVVLSGKAVPDSPYGLTRLWVDARTGALLQAEWQDKDGAPLRRYRALRLAVRAGRERALVAEVEDVRRGLTTRLSVRALGPARADAAAFVLR